MLAKKTLSILRDAASSCCVWPEAPPSFLFRPCSDVPPPPPLSPSAGVRYRSGPVARCLSRLPPLSSRSWPLSRPSLLPRLSLSLPPPQRSSWAHRLRPSLSSRALSSPALSTRLPADDGDCSASRQERFGSAPLSPGGEAVREAEGEAQC